MAAAKSAAAAAAEREEVFQMAEKEFEHRTEMFSKLAQTCFSKCVENRYKDSELNMAENSCIDKCVSKYSQVTILVGQLLQNNKGSM